MNLHKSQIKFTESAENGELIGFVTQISVSRKLIGVRENSPLRKKICLLSEELKGQIIPNLLYDVELKEMNMRNGYIVVSAKLVLFEAEFHTKIITRKTYRITITFGIKKVYFDPFKGKSESSRTVDGVIRLLQARYDIHNIDNVIEEFKQKAAILIDRMNNDINLTR